MAAIDLTDDCVLQYKMNEGITGATAVIDTSATASNGTASSNTDNLTTNDAIIDKGFNFNRLYTVALGTTLTLTDMWTINFWLKPTDGSPRPNYICGNAGPNGYISVTSSGGNSNVNFNNQGGSSVTWIVAGLLNNFKMYTFRAINGGAGVQLFINGALQANKVVDSDITLTLIGQGATGGPIVEGPMDIFNVFDASIDPTTEIDFLYNGGAGTEDLAEERKTGLLIDNSLATSQLVGGKLVR